MQVLQIVLLVKRDQRRADLPDKIQHTLDRPRITHLNSLSHGVRHDDVTRLLKLTDFTHCHGLWMPKVGQHRRIKRRVPSQLRRQQPQHHRLPSLAIPRGIDRSKTANTQQALQPIPVSDILSDIFRPRIHPAFLFRFPHTEELQHGL